MTTPRRDLPCTPRVARLLGPRPPGPRRLRALQAPIPAALVDEIEEVVATHLAAERGSVTGTERRAARLGAEIALGLDR